MNQFLVALAKQVVSSFINFLSLTQKLVNSRPFPSKSVSFTMFLHVCFLMHTQKTKSHEFIWYLQYFFENSKDHGWFTFTLLKYHFITILNNWSNYSLKIIHNPKVWTRADTRLHLLLKEKIFFTRVVVKKSCVTFN